MNQPNPTKPGEFYITFVGPIGYPATKSFRTVICNAILNGAQKITLLLSSSGGSTQEGFALYNFLSGLPVELHTHNIGSIESIANVVFLAGTKRFACPVSRFFNHDLTWAFVQETAARPIIKERSMSLDADAKQFVEVVTSRTTLTQKQLRTMKFLKKPLTIEPPQAQAYGIIHTISPVAIPAGAVTWNVEY